MYSIFTCAINAEILLRADALEGSFGVMAYAAAATVVFFCCTLVDVYKTGGGTIQFVVFLNSRFHSQKDYWETVFSKH